MLFEKDKLKLLNDLLHYFYPLDPRLACVRMPVKDRAGLAKIPVSTKKDLKAFAKRGLVRGTFNVTATSGTTDERLLVAHSEACYQAHLCRLARMYRLAGVKPGELCLNLCSYALNSGGRLMEAAYKEAGVGVIPLGILDIPEKTAEAVRLVRDLRPTVVNSYTNQLYDLFSVIGRKHSIRRCIVNGEPLSAGFKSRIEEMSGAQIHDHYGAMEFSGFAIALRARDKYMRVFDKGLLLEVEHPYGTCAFTGRGALLVTDLLNYAMPFVRYRLGDEVELVKRGGRLFIKVYSRLGGSILIDGEVYSSDALVSFIRDCLGHPQFVVKVEKDPRTYKDSVVLNVCVGAGRLPDGIAGRLDQYLGVERMCAVRIWQGVVPRTSSGKFRNIIDARTVGSDA